MSIPTTSDLWWKNAIIYCLDVETFFDSNGDGIGDFAGLTQRVDYLAGMGVTCIWLMPFYPTPNRDDGYDVLDFYGVDARLGSFGDLAGFVRTARDRGLRVIVDLVLNHTSTEHHWFRASSSDPHSPHREWYVWRDEVPEDGPKGIVFPDAEKSNWTYHKERGQYYLHRFYSHQADLNPANPAVRDEMAKVLGFWLEQGISGFRVDAVPFLIETEGIEGDPELIPHELLRDLRAFLNRRRGDAIMLGEVNLRPEEARRYFGDEGGDQLHMVFNFLVNQQIYLSLVRGDATPLREALARLPPIPDEGQWANFLRNHDELTLDKLTEAERQEVFTALGPDEDMQLFGRGLRRRLPSMVDGDQRRLRMLYSLMFSLPGTPVLFYGEEIGMAENLEVEGRASVRTPMQWSDERNAGFSTAPASALRRPLVEGRFGPQHVNVVDQRRRPDSLLSWMERLIRRRRECPEIGFGQCKVIETSEAGVLAHQCEWGDRILVAAHNFSEDACSPTLNLNVPHDFEGLVDLLADREYPPPNQLEVELGPFGYRWLHMRGAGRLLPL
ncbi:MAG: alpha-amylase family protein [Actinomycetota bacterium]|nr:alpha-amylase family protein [Actinomycetota bacterium]